MKKTRVLIFTLVFASLILAACGGGDSGEASSAVLTEAALIAADSLTQTAGAASPTPTATEIPPTATPTVMPPTATATQEGAGGQATNTPQQQSGGGTGCLRANLEYETIPDGTELEAGKNFTKLWRLKNVGSCTWTAGFAAIWVEGDLMGAESTVTFTDVDIPPGGYAMVYVDMQVPAEEGSYKGYWMLRSADGLIFGIGGNGKAWFWVDITVFDPNVD